MKNKLNCSMSLDSTLPLVLSTNRSIILYRCPLQLIRRDDFNILLIRYFVGTGKNYVIECYSNKFFLFCYDVTSVEFNYRIIIIFIIVIITLTLKEECRLRVLENRILRRIFGPKRDENGEWRRLHNEELPSLYRSSNIVRECFQNFNR